MMRAAAALCALALLAGCRDDVSTAVARGNILRNQGKTQEAIQSYQEAARLAPGSARVQLALADALYDAGREAEALAAYRAAEAAEPKNPTPLIGAARVLADEGNVAAADAELTRAIALDPRANAARLSRGNLRLSAGRTDDALADFTEASHREGRNPVVLYALVRGLLAKHDLPAAKATVDHLSEVAPHHVLVPYSRALLAAAQGDKPAALAALKDAVARSPADARAAEQDPLLAPLKDDPAFRALFAGEGK